MAVLKLKYGDSGEVLTITLDNLASAATREGDAISNVDDLFMDVLISACLTTNASAPTGDKCCYVYAYGSVDATVYTDNALGADGALTPTSPTNLKLLGVVSMPSASTSYFGGPWSLASAFGGVVPARWGIVVLNSTGNALDNTGGLNYVKYQGAQYETV
jgi:hypothetical protein